MILKSDVKTSLFLYKKNKIGNSVIITTQAYFYFVSTCFKVICTFVKMTQFYLFLMIC